jgi:hypothetical protein
MTQVASSIHVGLGIKSLMNLPAPAPTTVGLMTVTLSGVEVSSGYQVNESRKLCTQTFEPCTRPPRKPPVTSMSWLTPPLAAVV